ncbi:MAG: hypothetical protein F8N15_05465 [Methanobacterium sp.]|nr:hypothetical protein [Methanobacterium sp.]
MFLSLGNLATRANIVLGSAILALLDSPAFAASSSSTSGAAMPWDNTQTQIVNDLTGPWAKGMVIAAIAVTGPMAAFGADGSPGMKGSPSVYDYAVRGAHVMSGTPITLHQSLIRPNLLAGAEADLVQINGIVAVILIFGVATKLSFAFGVVLALGVHWGLVQLAKRDPQWFQVYKRHIRYQAYYPARAHIGAPVATVRSIER